ncbi:ATP-dependent helicase [Derxia gummosa]|uniref:DNA 3'-5' helicase n=1 Tax=Derxia gummosa DSM 723 TaxID=1121388 RepID=A0A8B6X386_9BURK|nr:ATP-dependent helicase [Derxia gummosa]
MPAQPQPSDTDPLATLNPAQREAVEYGIGAAREAETAPLLVIAGAGSGKTNTLAHRVAHLVAHGADPRRILMLTFSRRAAAEMTRRVSRLLSRRLGLRADAAESCLDWAGTFHAIGARLLREHAERIGLAPTFTIHDREDSADLLNLVRHELGLSAKAKRFPTKGTCLAIYSRAVNTTDDLDVVLKTAFPWCLEWEAELKQMFGAYVEAKQKQAILDYDDLLLWWAQMMEVPELAAEVAARFDHVLVDEYQDTNRLQAAILLALRPDGRGLTVVGDDAQSIYSFRAATVRNILDFPAQFAQAARVVTLDRNYRSTRPILDAANGVIGLAAERFTKNLWTERESTARPRLVTVYDEAEQARFVASAVLERREAGTPLKRQAVLFRSSSHSAALEVELTRRNIPFVKFGGLKFLEAAHVKDLLGVLRWADNPRNRLAGFRVMQLLAGIGPATAGKVLDAMEASATPWLAFDCYEPPAAAAGEWEALAALMRALRGARADAGGATTSQASASVGAGPAEQGVATPAVPAGWPAEVELIRRWYTPFLERRFDDALVREADLLQLESIAATYRSRERFLTELTLDPPEATSDESGVPLRDEDYLILSTIHSAKGQEWEAVSLLNAVDGCLPSDMATSSAAEIEEERRLLYVAMTRAKDALALVIPQRFHVTGQTPGGDRHVFAARTRFIPAALLPLFEQASWPPPSPLSHEAAAMAREAAKRPVIDLGAKLRGRWG